MGKILNIQKVPKQDFYDYVNITLSLDGVIDKIKIGVEEVMEIIPLDKEFGLMGFLSTIIDCRLLALLTSGEDKIENNTRYNTFTDLIMSEVIYVNDDILDKQSVYKIHTIEENVINTISNKLYDMYELILELLTNINKDVSSLENIHIEKFYYDENNLHKVFAICKIVFKK